MPDRIEKSVDIAAPIAKVWAALSDHRAFGTWFRVALDQPFAVGEPSTGRMTYPGYEHMPWRAEIVAIDPPHRLAWRWPHMDGDGQVREDWARTLVEFTLTALSDDRTRVTVVESGFEALPEDARNRALRSNTGGWEEQMRNIRAYAEG